MVPFTLIPVIQTKKLSFSGLVKSCLMGKFFMSACLCPANPKLTNGVQVVGGGVGPESCHFFVSLLGAFSSQKQCQYVMILSGICSLVSYFSGYGGSGPLTLAPRNRRQGASYKFEASWGFVVSSWPPRAK